MKTKETSKDKNSLDEIQNPNDTTVRAKIRIKNGTIIVASDAHYWPGRATTAHKALVHFVKELKPSAIIMNGDVLDGASISRHSPIGWENRPSLIEELKVCQRRLGEIEKAALPGTELIWTLGNHDSRYETRLATVAPEYAHVKGMHLKDHFKAWRPAWSVWINDTLIIKHRWKGGDHAAYNNAVKSGKSIATGHLHNLHVTPFTDYNGTRWGIDTGTLADPHGPQFTDYTEDSPRNWRSGFVVFTFENGRLLWPELVHVINKERVEFRGKTYKIG